MKMFKHDDKTSKKESQSDQRNASHSKRVMRTERGSQAEHIKVRRFDRASTKARRSNGNK